MGVPRTHRVQFSLFLTGALLVGLVIPGCFNAEKIELRSLDNKSSGGALVQKIWSGGLKVELNVEAGNGPTAIRTEPGGAAMNLSKVSAGGDFNKRDFQADGGPGNFRLRGGLYGSLP